MSNDQIEISPVTSIFVSVGLSIALGFTISLPLGTGFFGALAISIICWGFLAKGSVKIALNEVGVITFLGTRTKFYFTEGWNISIPFLWNIILVDKKERVWEIPDPIKEPGKDGFTFFVGISGDPDVPKVEIKSRVILKTIISDTFEYLSYDPISIEKALRNKAIDEIRSRGASMSAEMFIANKNTTAGEVKEAVNKQYDFIEVTGLDIVKADFADAEVKKNEQARKLERSKTQSQAADMLGDGGTSDRISKVAAMLTSAGLPADEATRKAIEIIQTQEGRMTHSRIELSGGSNPIAEAVAMWKGGNL